MEAAFPDRTEFESRYLSRVGPLVRCGPPLGGVGVASCDHPAAGRRAADHTGRAEYRAPPWRR
jgi:hypothetical protein